MQINQTLMHDLLQQAHNSPRKRAFVHLHQSHAEPVQRVLIAMLPDSYVVPHQHPMPGQFELFVVLHGAVDLLQFDAFGHLLSRQTLGAGLHQVAVELAPGVWHSLIALGDGVVFLEIKAGPFDPDAPRCFAEFAPSENSQTAVAYLSLLKMASVGTRCVLDNNSLELNS